jgi:ribose 5-phosphate isomerase A
MDLKKEAAREAFRFINDNSSVGLGDGTTIRWLAEYIIEGIRRGLNIRLYSSSFSTEKMLLEASVPVLDFSKTDQLDQYFDGCDQVDEELNAFKSGAGIHTTEKLLASMAKSFILLADASKYVSTLDNRYPLVLEVLPPAVLFVCAEMKSRFPEVSLLLRMEQETGRPAVTRYGNQLIDCRFPVLPDLETLQNVCKSISGVLEISLFYQIARKAIIVSNQGTRIIEREKY